MAEKPPPMARMQLLVPDELKTAIEIFANDHGMSANEAARILLRRGLAASGQNFTAGALLDQLTHIIRNLEARADEKPQPR